MEAVQPLGRLIAEENCIHAVILLKRLVTSWKEGSQLQASTEGDTEM